MKHFRLVALLLLGALLVVLMMVGLQQTVQADFDPTILSDSVKITEGFCEPHHCVMVVKEGKTYVIAVNNRGQLVLIWEVIGDDFFLIWAKDLV